MLFVRWVVAAMATTSLMACGADSRDDAGYDVWRPESAVDHVLVGDVPVDSSAFDDVAPTVDVIPYDVPGVTDARAMDAAYGDAAPVDARSGCMALADQYAMAVHVAESCSSREDCSEVVCETLCCTCRVYVNPSSADDADLARYTREWRSGNCAAEIACPAMACNPPASAECSSANRCTTMRSASGG